MSFWEHVEELRKMVMRVLVILVISFLCTTYFADDITEFLLKPLRETLILTKTGGIVYHSIFEKTLVQLDVSIWWSIMFSSPFWFYQVWRFIRPGLHAYEIKAVKPFMIFGWMLFVAGMCCGYYFAFPVAFKFLSLYGVTNVEANISLRDYISTASQILLFLGIIFQFPNILLILGFMGLVTKQLLRKFRRYVYVGLSIFAAIFSPADVMSMLAVWIPLCLLYEVGIVLVAWIVHPYLKKVHIPKDQGANENI
jgi:sec-independent protein translocase protein TatC